jgi:hypothetical protein
MKEDIMVLQVREEFSSMFNKLSGLDDVDEETNSGGILFLKTLVDVCGILNVQISGLNNGLIFYLLKYSEVVRGCSG